MTVQALILGNGHLRGVPPRPSQWAQHAARQPKRPQISHSLGSVLRCYHDYTWTTQLCSVAFTQRHMTCCTHASKRCIILIDLTPHMHQACCLIDSKPGTHASCTTSTHTHKTHGEMTMTTMCCCQFNATHTCYTTMTCTNKPYGKTTMTCA